MMKMKSRMAANTLRQVETCLGWETAGWDVTGWDMIGSDMAAPLSVGCAMTREAEALSFRRRSRPDVQHDGFPFAFGRDEVEFIGQPARGGIEIAAQHQRAA